MVNFVNQSNEFSPDLSGDDLISYQMAKAIFLQSECNHILGLVHSQKYNPIVLQFLCMDLRRRTNLLLECLHEDIRKKAQPVIGLLEESLKLLEKNSREN
jgi:hypothetical protein